jgi:hypothetical protein
LGYDPPMRTSWLQRLLPFLGGRSENVLQIFTPQVAAHRGTGTKLVLAGATVFGLAIASAVALGSLLMMMVAVGTIYFLVTQVLGIRLDVDPRAFVERAQQYAQYSRN